MLTLSNETLNVVCCSALVDKHERVVTSGNTFAIFFSICYMAIAIEVGPQVTLTIYQNCEPLIMASLDGISLTWHSVVWLLPI